MELRQLGHSDLRVAPICLGTNTCGWTTDEQASLAVLDTYVEGGGNFIDTADTYSRWAPGNRGGESESAIGSWLSTRGSRHRVVIATKVGGQMGGNPHDRGLSRRHLLDGVEASLRRLQTDYIDLYQSHWDDSETPLDETLETYDRLVLEGKVRVIGASNHTASRLAEALGVSERRGLARYEIAQPHYNLVEREEYERDLEPLCLERGLSVITYYSLASGFLSGKYRPGQPLPTSPRAATVQQKYLNDRGFAVLSALDQVAAAHGATVARVALAWLMARPSVTAPIASATSPAQVRELLSAAELTLTGEDIGALDRASDWR
ncbi:MAG: aldo/keto reductase [Chloroflexi bacterium]|nr:aldo/keto reductase [Chloroflexota bacterium]